MKTNKFADVIIKLAHRATNEQEKRKKILKKIATNLELFRWNSKADFDAIRSALLAKTHLFDEEVARCIIANV
jgi:hypothetical protein